MEIMKTYRFKADKINVALTRIGTVKGMGSIDCFLFTFSKRLKKAKDYKNMYRQKIPIRLLADLTSYLMKNHESYRRKVLYNLGIYSESSIKSKLFVPSVERNSPNTILIRD